MKLAPQTLAVLLTLAALVLAPSDVPAAAGTPVPEKLWSVQPLAPAAGDATIDGFLATRLAEKKLAPVGPADKRTLIRRATYDLTGLPPTPKEIHAFLADDSPNAFAKLIDRLLASTAYGEQWGRHWLDVVRYGDTSGCSADFPVPSAYRYRNYVIDSFNRDKPYDQFIREQVAGDLLPAASETERYENITATGYLAIARRFGNRPAEFHLTLEDVIDNLGKTTLGLSLGCARCHDHKFDPVPTTDYYALYGIFSSSRFAFPGTGDFRQPKDFVPLARPEEATEFLACQTGRAALDIEINKWQEEKKALDQLPPGPEKVADAKSASGKTSEELKALLDDARARLKVLETKSKGIAIPIAYAVSEGKSSDAAVQRKGDPTATGETVPRGFLGVLGGQRLPVTAQGSGRLELAGWLTSRDNPLFARVMVNRIWQYHFGKGLVPTPNDFGNRGQLPSHPELLDFLATRFIASGYSVKAMHRLVMLTQAYQRAATDNPAAALVDPDNQLLARFNSRRLSAEEIRDSILALSGALERSMGGPHPFPPAMDWKYTEHKPYVAVYETTQRTVYLMQQRIKKHPFLQVFDGADPNASTPERQIATTPLQALFLMNDPFTHEQAARFGSRIATGAPDLDTRLRDAFESAYGRLPSADELEWIRNFLREAAGKSSTDDAFAALARVLWSSNEFLHVY
jgi:hypothetical protein